MIGHGYRMSRVLLLSVVACIASSALAGEVPGHARYLLLDARVVDRAEGVALRVGTVSKHPANPLFREDKPWEPRFDNLYANVIYDEEEELYKCWYSPFIIDKAHSTTPHERREPGGYIRTLRSVEGKRREMGVCYAQSTDGLAWEKPLMDVCRFEGQKSNLVVIGPHGAGVFKDRHEKDPQRRYKMFYKAGSMTVAFSPDGLNWSEPAACPEMQARGDTHNNAFRAPELDKYVAVTRLWDGQRIVGRSQSADFIRWTKAVEVLRGEKSRQTYAMPVFRYANVYLGLVMILKTDQDRVHCELTWSPDTVTWHRIDAGTPLIANSETRGEYDWGCAYAALAPVVLDDEIRIYYGASNGPHTDWRDGFFALATLRPDGFAAYEPAGTDGRGTIVTVPLKCVGTQLELTADAEGGLIGVELLDAAGKRLARSRPVTGDTTRGVVKWERLADLATLRNQPIRLKFTLDRAKLYAFGFTP